MSIRWKIVIGITLIQMALLVLLSWQSMRMTIEANESELRGRAHTMVALFAGMNEDSLQRGEDGALEHNATVAASQQGVVYARIRRDGQVVAQAGDTATLSRPFVEDNRYLDVKDGVFDVSSEVRVGGKQYGTVEMGFATSKIDQIVGQARTRIIGISAGMVLLVALFAHVFATLLTRRFRKMEWAAGEITAGKLGVQVEVSGNDELTMTMRAFNSMSSKLMQSERELAKTMQEALGTKIRMQAIVDHAAEGIITISETGIVETFNHAAARTFGYMPEEVIGQNVGMLMPQLHRAGHDDHIQQYLQTGEQKVPGVPNREVVGARKDGSTIPLRLLVSEARIMGKRSFVGILEDISERKHAELELQRSFNELKQANEKLKQTNEKLEQAQNQLMQSEKMASVGQLAAGVAHEINNPIGYVYSNLGSLEKYLNEMFGLLNTYEQAEASIADAAMAERVRQEKQKADLEFLREDMGLLMRESKEGITRVKKIVQDLKDFSHVDQDEEWKMEDLHKGLDTTLSIVHNDLKYKARVVKEYGDVPEIECIMSQLNQVFMNMLVNAGHAIEDHGKEQGVIALRTGCQGNEVWVAISDTGKGIAPENLKRIFDPFFTTKPVGKGTGLGLSLSYGIVQKHHGRIEVESEVGKGTTFKVILPIRQPEAAAA
ncbi:MAG: PAS domain S-box protein [Pseudomonadota bacterium]